MLYKLNKKMEKKYTISIYTENMVGLLARITAIFTRRHINIESLTASETEEKGVSRFTIVVHVAESMVITVTKQINRIVEVLYAEFHEDVALIHTQIALYKVSVKDPKKRVSIQALATQNNARILASTEEYMVLENTGGRESIEGFLRDLQVFGDTEFVRSGRIALTTASEGVRLKEVLPKLAELNRYHHYEWEWKN